ncbi:MAG TPA: M23 family metallopeptidase [Gemmatimonadaceae bacterium]|nr:M23 family metallopeptidase [Gemmatimonadaceae bacterium]
MTVTPTSGRPVRRSPRFVCALGTLVAGATLLATAAACQRFEELREAVGITAHERYVQQLRASELDRTALGRDWLAAAESALARPHEVTLPFAESSYLPPEEAVAVAYRFDARRGERLQVEVRVDGADEPLVFIDLYSASDSGPAASRVVSAEEGERSLRHDVRRDGGFVLRIQPELLRGGRFVITVRTGASLAFPVSGRDSRAIRSFWGADRDGGRRMHQGVDIFAPRGTAVLAAADGFVSRVSTTSLGGRVIWMRDLERGQSLYYAHLDSQFVSSGTRVRAGDTLGLVGNTGNARGTQPHLHFGIYSRGEGAVDPFPFVHEPRIAFPALAADTTALGRFARVARDSASLHISPDPRAPAVARLAQLTAVRLLGASGSWYRVRLPDGAEGWVSARAVESATRPIRSTRVAAAAAVRDGPLPIASVVDSVDAGTALPVLGRFADWWLVEAPSGRLAWLVSN